MMPPPADRCDPRHGCGATGPVRIERGDRCLGAVGSNCDGALFPLDDVFAEVGCDPGGTCWVNAGSWVHDECCVKNRSGYFCGDWQTVAGTACRAEMEMALHRVRHNLGWQRSVSMSRVDTDGIVDFAEYCAPSGTLLAGSDSIRCCSGRARGFNPRTDTLGNVVLDGSFIPVICLPGAPPAPPSGSAAPGPSFRPCARASDCDPGDACVLRERRRVCIPGVI